MNAAEVLYLLALPNVGRFVGSRLGIYDWLGTDYHDRVSTEIMVGIALTTMTTLALSRLYLALVKTCSMAIEMAKLVSTMAWSVAIMTA